MKNELLRIYKGGVSYTLAELDKKWEFCSGNEEEIKVTPSKSSVCFHCCNLLDNSKIKEFVETSAICPRCGLDSVIPASKLSQDDRNHILDFAEIMRIRFFNLTIARS